MPVILFLKIAEDSFYGSILESFIINKKWNLSGRDKILDSTEKLLSNYHNPDT